MTVQLVRLVLELSRPLRQELHHPAPRGRARQLAQLDEAFEEVRVVFPSSVEATFVALQTPALGAIMTGERGFLDPLFRTLAKEKRECLGRLVASLDDIERTTARQLYEAAATCRRCSSPRSSASWPSCSPRTSAGSTISSRWAPGGCARRQEGAAREAPSRRWR